MDTREKREERGTPAPCGAPTSEKMGCGCHMLVTVVSMSLNGDAEQRC